MKVVGFEGSWPEYCLGTYGAVALTDGAVLKNGITGYAMPYSETSRYAKDGALTLLEEQVDVGERQILYVAAFRNKISNILESIPDFQMLSNVYYFFDQAGFDDFVKKTCKTLLKFILQSGGFIEALDVACTLAPRDPFVQATRVYKSKNPEKSERIAKILLSEANKLVFDSALNDLKNGDFEKIFER